MDYCCYCCLRDITDSPVSYTHLDVYKRQQYLLRFIQEYEKVGINLRGLTIQNEAAASQRRESCLYTAQEEIVFALEHLRPVLDQA